MARNSPQNLGQLAARLRNLADVPARASRKAAALIQDLIRAQYREGRDPYGKPWARLAPYTIEKGRHNPPLTDTGVMRATTIVFPIAGAGIQITVGPAYAKFAQFGWRHHWHGVEVPARPILPDGKRLPLLWRAAIARATKEAFEES